MSVDKDKEFYPKLLSQGEVTHSTTVNTVPSLRTMVRNHGKKLVLSAKRGG